jgi:hypothetical protein
MLVRAPLALAASFIVCLVLSLSAPPARSTDIVEYVSLGDSLAALPGYTDTYAAHIEDDLGVTVHHNKLGVPGWRSADLLNALRTNQSYRDAVAEAHLVTWNIGLNDLMVARGLYVNGQCGGADSEDCLRTAVSVFEDNWDAIVAELHALTAGRNVTLRTMTSYRPFIDFDIAGGILDVFTPYWADLNGHISASVQANSIAPADVYAEFNGVSGTEDPVLKGYISEDIIHMSDAGNDRVADMLRELAYAPFGIDDDGDRVIDLYDNCPGIANADQANHDRDLIDLSGYGRTFDDITWPFSDELGDACDDDADNDGLMNEDETNYALACPSASAALDPYERDSDGDRVLDGAECFFGTDPASNLSRPARPQTGDADRDGLVDLYEFVLGTDGADADSDNDGILDGVEVKGFNSDPLDPDSDGDGCSDGLEIASVNGDRRANVIDLSQILKATGTPSSANFVPPFDQNRDDTINVIDLQFSARQAGACG